MDKEDEYFWEFHQTMTDNHIWCANNKVKKLNERM
jgi:hypothetical protein